MTHIPHPCRISKLFVEQLNQQMLHRRVGHVRDMLVVQPDMRLETLYARAKKILEPHCSGIFDVSALISKLPEQNISRFKLTDVTIPHGNAYYDFGRQDQFVLNAERDVYIEGAYITQTETPDEMSEFQILLVCNDPSYGASGRALPDAIESNVDMCWLPISAKQNVGKALKFGNAGITSTDSNFIGPYEVCRVAFEFVAKSMCYLFTLEPDIEFTYAEGANTSLKNLALAGDPSARNRLMDDGYPMIQSVGRHISKVLELKEPDLNTRDEVSSAFHY